MITEKELEEIEERAKEEVWKSVEGYEGVYEVSNLGYVRRLSFINGKTKRKYEPPKVLSLAKKRQYEMVGLHKDGTRTTRAVHRLVATAFHGPCPNGYECAHLNGIRDDNRAENLKWVSKKENHSHKWLHGTQQAGERNAHSRFKQAQVQAMRLILALGGKPSEIGSIFKEDTEIAWQVTHIGWKNLPDPYETIVSNNEKLRTEVKRLREALEKIKTNAMSGILEAKEALEVDSTDSSGTLCDIHDCAKKALEA